MATIYFNGRYVDERQARVPVSDPALSWGVGLFEVMRAYDGTAYCVEQHLGRLRDSARTLGLDVRIPPVERVVVRLLKRNRLRGGYVRLTVTGNGQRWVVAKPWTAPAESVYRRGSKLILVDWIRDPRCPTVGHKTLNYLEPMVARWQAEKQRAVDAVFRGPDGQVQEGSRSNVFAVESGALLTPPAADGLLAGITRQRVIDLARASGIEVRSTPFTLERLARADEIFITSTLLEVMPIRQINEGKTAVVKKTPGPVTRALRQAYRDAVRRVCGPQAYD